MLHALIPVRNRRTPPGARMLRLLALFRLGAGTVMLGIGAGLGIPHAYAQEVPRPVLTTAPKTLEAPLVAEDPIDPIQPLKPSFLINVSVEKEPEPSGNYVVDAAGNILLRVADMLTPVAVKEQTPAQAAETLTTFLKKYMRDPQVKVSIISVPRPTVVVGGAVRASGPVLVNRTTTLVDILSKAEWNDNSDLSQVRLTRRQTVNGQETRRVLTLHVDTYMKPDPGKDPDEAQNPLLQDKDTIFVPFKSLAGNGVVTVAGEVTKPTQGMLLRANPSVTLREAISLAGGLTPGANRKAINVRRAHIATPFVVDMEKADANDPAHNLVLQPDDVVFVERLQSSAFFNVQGGFLHAGKFPFDKKQLTLTQAIMEAGGLAPYAKDKQGCILRHADDNPKNTKLIAFNWKNIVSGKEHDREILPGDTIWVAPGGLPGQSQNFLSMLSSLTPLSMLFNTLGR